MSKYIALGDNKANWYRLGTTKTVRGEKFTLRRVMHTVDETWHENEIKGMINSSGNAIIYVDEKLEDLVQSLGFTLIEED